MPLLDTDSIPTGEVRERGAASAAETTTHAGSNTAADRARKLLGERAEEAAAAHLAAQGLEILARNIRVGRLEIDLVALDGPVIAIVEVRTRGERSYVRALDSIDATKRARVRRAGERLWRDRFRKMRGVERMRFDAVAVTFTDAGAAVVEHVKAAF